MIPLVGTVLSQARTLLNDDGALNWPDPKLIPKVQQAFNQMQADLLIAGIPIINAVSVIMTVPLLATDDSTVDLSTVSGYPVDMIMPMEMKERAVGEHQQDFVDMLEVDFIPQIERETKLRYWTWYQQTIVVRGATAANQVMLRYQRLLSLPNLNTDNTSVILSELYLSYKVAALASLASRDLAIADKLDAIANVNLYKIVQMNVKTLQNLPTRRRPYHRGKGPSIARSF